MEAGVANGRFSINMLLTAEGLEQVAKKNRGLLFSARNCESSLPERVNEIR